jgi:two-component system chemotaxis response regulator CheB
MKEHRLVVIGSSAGGVNALRELAGFLDSQLNASVLVVQHVSPNSESILPHILTRAGKLPARHPFDGEQIHKGVIYVAPPDHHMIVSDDHILVKKGPKENRFRPSIDVLMRSAAYWFGPNVIGIVLTGRLDDGTSGLWSIKQLGGITIVQNPDDALYPSMPTSALKKVDVDYNLPLSQIGPMISKLAADPVADHTPKDHEMLKRIKTEIDISAQQYAMDRGILEIGKPTNFTCPECGGALLSVEEGETVRFRCHTGHAYSSDSLLTEITGAVEARLWQALKSIEEGVMLLEQSATKSESSGNSDEAADYYKKSTDLRSRAKSLLNFIYKKKEAFV